MGFQKFKEKTASYPDQVLRYNKGDKPVWVSDSNIPESVPDCELCGSKRKFEFQIMSQMLNYLHLDSVSDRGVDWGTLAVYVCKITATWGSRTRKNGYGSKTFPAKISEFFPSNLSPTMNITNYNCFKLSLIISLFIINSIFS